MINEDIDFIINTDPIKDDCPCPELVHNFEKDLTVNHGSTDFNLMLGIIWLFCDVNKSLEYFTKTHKLEPKRQKIIEIIHLLKNYIHSKKAS